MPRERLSREMLIPVLVREISRQLRHEPPDLARRVEIRHREGEPNWDATIGIAPLHLLRAFNDALATTQAMYDLELPTTGD
jgi:hypothetical protein